MDTLPPFPTLRTERLLLREILPEDAEALFAIHGDAENMRWFGTDPLPDLAAAESLVNTFAGLRKLANPGVRWGLQRHGQPGLIGSCGLFGWNRNWHKCSTGYELAPSLRGQGLMREALQAAIAWGFEAMELNRIEAQIHPSNTPSQRLVESLGFQFEGLQRQVGRWAGAFHDLQMWGLVRSDWEGGAASRREPRQ